jgi:predicted DCC family thiol-disulfide oxidoreductase YuxK
MIPLTIIYDGECPLCREYTRLVALRENGYAVELINAREADHPLVVALWQQGYNLDSGMVVRCGTHITWGAEAMHTLARLSGKRPDRLWIIDVFFRHSWLAQRLYPLCRIARRIVLGVKKKKRLKPKPLS